MKTNCYVKHFDNTNGFKEALSEAFHAICEYFYKRILMRLNRDQISTKTILVLESILHEHGFNLQNNENKPRNLILTAQGSKWILNVDQDASNETYIYLERSLDFLKKVYVFTLTRNAFGYLKLRDMTVGITFKNSYDDINSNEFNISSLANLLIAKSKLKNNK